MTHLSSPESVLKKLDAVYEQIDDLHEALDIFQGLNEQVHSSCERIQAHEARLTEQLDKSRTLETLYANAIRELELITGNSEKKLDRLLSELNQEQVRISETLESVDQGKQDTEMLRQTLESDITRIRENIAAETEQFATRLNALKDESRTKVSQAIEDGKKTIEDRLSSLSVFREEAQEELITSQKALEAFRDQITNNFDNKIEVLFKQQLILQQTVNEEISGKFSGESRKLKAFKDRMDENLNHKLEELSVQQVRFQKSVSEGMFSKIAEEIKKINQLQEFVNAESEKIAFEFEHEQIKIRRSLESVARQKTDIEDLRQTLTQHFTSQLETIKTDARKNLAQTVEESKYIVEEELDRLTAFKTQSEQEIQNLKKEAETFKTQMKADLASETEGLSSQQSLFRESVTSEISDKFAEEGKAFSQFQNLADQKIETVLSDFEQEKALINETLASLRTENKEVRELGQTLETEIARINDHIADKTKSLTAQMETLREDSQEKLGQGLEENRQAIQQESDGLSALMKDAREEIQTLKSEWDALKDQTAESLRQQSGEIESGQASLREAMTQEVASRVSEHAEAAQNASEKLVKERMNEFVPRQTALMEKVTGRLSKLEQTLSDMQAEQKALHQREQEKSAKFAAYIKKLAQRQNERQPVLPNHEKRIQRLERAVLDMKKKKI